ncbi:MAG: 2'-5' RNA ligase family protein [Chitinophagales bacterium]|nr:2'-5' RNA ligase family protein [Chitinophagales bacterium]
MAAIEPPSDLAASIRLLQEEFAGCYGSAAALKPPVHITFSPPVHLDHPELEHYSSLLKEVALQTSPIELQLDGFDFFIKNKVVFIRVVPHALLNAMHQDFERKWQNKDALPYRPHITIGYRNLDTAIFKDIVKDYSKRTFKDKLGVNNLHLWQHTDGRWKTIDSMPFQII